MISVREGELADARTAALLRPVTAEWTAVTPAMRRLELEAGPVVEAQCRKLGELPVGSAVITAAGDIDVEFLVHVIVRSADQPVTPAVVRRALLNGMRRMVEWAIASVAMPPLGTGAGNLEAEESADAMIPVLLEHMHTASYPGRVEIVADSAYECEVFERRLAVQSAE